MFYMVYIEGGGAPSYRHSTAECAETEAKRLTEMTGKKSFVLQSIKSVEIPEKFIVKDLRPTRSSEDDDLPF